MYQNECEKFYGIPGKYFDSDIDNRLLYLLCIIILLFMGIMPTLLKKYYEKKDKLTKGNLVEAIFLSVIIGIELGCINVYNLIEIMKQTYRTCDFYIKCSCLSCIFYSNCCYHFVFNLCFGSDINGAFEKYKM